jgi:hypothetical protein
VIDHAADVLLQMAELAGACRPLNGDRLAGAEDAEAVVAVGGEPAVA